MVDQLGDIEFELGEAYGSANVWGVARDMCEWHRKGERIAENWQATLGEFVNDFADALVKKLGNVTRIESLETEVLLLKNRCTILERTGPIVVPIETLAPEPYGVVKPFHCIVRFEGGEYVASFFDANISTSGDTHSEAMSNLKDLIVTMFEMLAEMDDAQLGPGPLRQKKVLREFIRRNR